MEAGRAELAACQQTLRLVWLAMTAAVATYAVVLLAILGPETPPPDTQAEALHNALTVAGIAVGALSMWWRRRFLGSDPEAPALTVARLQASAIVVWALSEAVALVGFVLAILTRNVWEFVPFGLASIALLLLHHPFRLPYERLSPREA